MSQPTIYSISRTDIELSKSTGYLSEKIIKFYFAYLNEQFTIHGKLQLLICSDFEPTNSPDTINQLKSVMESQVEYSLIAVCGRKTETDLGGSQVSLMEVERQGNQLTLRHFDCRSYTNSAAARHVAEAINRLVPLNMTIKPSVNDDLFEEASCPQLTGTYDSGAYVLCCSEILCRTRSGLFSIEVTSLDNRMITNFASKILDMLNV